jgi:thiol-disulfide isomerase/thioredoxin/Tfp pilus assembly protein PilF
MLAPGPKGLPASIRAQTACDRSTSDCRFPYKPQDLHSEFTMRTLAFAVLFVTLPAVSIAQEKPAPADAAVKPAAQEAVTRAKDLSAKGDLDGARAAVEQAIAADPDCIAAHELLREVAWRQRGRGRDKAEAKAATDALLQQYEAWSKRFPDSYGVQFGIGAIFSSQEDPRARPHLLQAVRGKPDLAKAWEMLSIDAERWGERDRAHEYMSRASAAEPQSPDYAFYAASNLREIDRAQWVRCSLAVAERFPQSERGAQALYWLGQRATTDAERMKYWEQARTQFPPENFDWTRSAMPGLFDARLRTEPAKALALAKDLETRIAAHDGEEWKARRALAEQWLDAQRLVAEKRFAEARQLFEQMKIDRHSSNAQPFALRKAEVTAAAGDVQAAYDGLLARMVTTPEDEVDAALVGHGEKLGRSKDQVRADVCARRDAQSKPAPAFALQRYGADGKATLDDFKGKVVLLTFWFPGCGPCRGEFPNFEHVMARFRGRDVAYVGVNTEPDQDDYVLPFLAGTKYSFTPLRGDDAITKPDAFNVRGCPTNFLIDQAGRIVYRNFRIDDGNEILLQRMIESLLDHPPAPRK